MTSLQAGQRALSLSANVIMATTTSIKGTGLSAEFAYLKTLSMVKLLFKLMTWHMNMYQNSWRTGPCVLKDLNLPDKWETF